MSSYATTSGSGPFKPVIVINDNFYEAKEFDNEDKALKYAECILSIIFEDIDNTMSKYKFVSIDK